jgi:hypothetical protein
MDFSPDRRSADDAHAIHSNDQNPKG